MIVSDNGCELTSVVVLRWSIGRLDWHYIVPGKPAQNAFIESFTVGWAPSALTTISS